MAAVVPEVLLLSTDRAFDFVALEQTIGRTPGLADCGVPFTRAVLANLLDVCRRRTPCVLVAEAALIQELHLPQTLGTDFTSGNVLVVAVIEDGSLASYRDVLRLGCMGAVPRGESGEVFARALRAVCEGEIWAPRRALPPLFRQLLTADSSRRLTPREREVLELIAEGLQNRGIADRLCISRETVRWHIRTVYGKLGVKNREGAIEYAASAGLLSPTKPPAAAGRALSVQKSAS